MFLPDIAGTPPRQVLERQRTVHHLLRNLIIGPALENYPATVHSGVRSHVNQHIGRADDLLIVLHHDKRVADVPELAQDSDKPVRVTWMQADAWFVKTDVMDGLKFFDRIAIQRGMEEDFNTGNMMYKARRRISFGFSDPRAVFGSEGAG